MKEERAPIHLALFPNRDKEIFAWLTSIPVEEREKALLFALREHIDEKKRYSQTKEEMKQELLREILQKIRLKIDELEIKIEEEKEQALEMKRIKTSNNQGEVDPKRLDEKLDQLIDFF